MACQRAVVGIEFDRLKEERHRLVNFIAQRQDGGEHVERVIVFGRLIVCAAQLFECLVEVVGV